MAEHKASVIEQVRRRDQLLFFPFDGVDPFLQLLREAAERPDVMSIKITIYRLATASKVAHILCKAADNGKELARFFSSLLMRARISSPPSSSISASRLRSALRVTSIA